MSMNSMFSKLRSQFAPSSSSSDEESPFEDIPNDKRRIDPTEYEIESDPELEKDTHAAQDNTPEGRAATAAAKAEAERRARMKAFAPFQGKKK